MLVVRIELWPNGDAGRSSAIAVMGIANIAGLAGVSDYLVLRRSNVDDWLHGVVERHRRADGVWPLIAQAAAHELAGDAESLHSIAVEMADLLDTIPLRATTQFVSRPRRAR